MASIWKELMFLHGHFVRPEDLLDEPAGQADAAAVQRDTSAAPRAASHIADADLACGGCA